MLYWSSLRRFSRRIVSQNGRAGTRTLSEDLVLWLLFFGWPVLSAQICRLATPHSTGPPARRHEGNRQTPFSARENRFGLSRRNGLLAAVMTAHSGRPSATAAARSETHVTWRPSVPIPGAGRGHVPGPRQRQENLETIISLTPRFPNSAGDALQTGDVGSRADDLVRAKPWPMIVILAEARVILGSHSVQTQ